MRVTSLNGPTMMGKSICYNLSINTGSPRLTMNNTDTKKLIELIGKLPPNLSVSREHDYPDDMWVIRDVHKGANGWPLYRGPRFSSTEDVTLYLMRTLEGFYEDCGQ